MTARYVVSVWHGECGSLAIVIDSKLGRVKGRTSTMRDGAAFKQLADIQARALNHADMVRP